TGFDPRMFPVIRLLRGRIAAYDMHLRGIADSCGCDLVDLWSMPALKDVRAWSPDRLHLTTEGHRQGARPPCEGPGIPGGGARPGGCRWGAACRPRTCRSAPGGWPRAARTPAGPNSTRVPGYGGGWAARPAATGCSPSAPTSSRSDRSRSLSAGQAGQDL